MNRFAKFNVDTFTILVILSRGLSTAIAQTELNEDHNEFCKPHPTLIAVDSPLFRLFPFFVTLQRCGGSANYISPGIMGCVAATIRDVKINAQYVTTGERKIVVVKNHTSCKAQCVNTADMCDPETQDWDPSRCSCSCKYQDSPPEPCPARFRWNKDYCECRCNVQSHELNCFEKGKVWSQSKCGCECPQWRTRRCQRKKKVLDENTCECVEPKLITGARKDDETCMSKYLLYGIIIGEFLLLAVLLDICLFVKGSGFMFCLQKALSRFLNGKKDPPLSPRSHERTTYL